MLSQLSVSLSSNVSPWDPSEDLQDQEQENFFQLDSDSHLFRCSVRVAASVSCFCLARVGEAVLRRSYRRFVIANMMFLLLFAGMPSFAAAQGRESRNFDVRTSLAAAMTQSIDAAQLDETERLRQQIPDLAASFDAQTGVTRTLSQSRSDFLRRQASQRPSSSRARILTADAHGGAGCWEANRTGFKTEPRVESGG